MPKINVLKRLFTHNLVSTRFLKINGTIKHNKNNDLSRCDVKLTLIYFRNIESVKFRST